MSTITGSSVPIRADRVVQAEIDGDIVLMSPQSFRYFALAGTGEDVWSLIDGQRSVDDIVADLAERFDAESAEIRRQVLDFLSSVQAAGLVRC